MPDSPSLPPMMGACLDAPLPAGTLTFLFTDIEGSARLWEHQPDKMPASLARHDELLHQAITRHRGFVFKTVGDAFCAAFACAPDAVRACLDAQRVLEEEQRHHPDRLPLPIKVRMALHSGLAQERDNDYFGPTLNRIARLLSTGYGGQVLLSAATQELSRELLPTDATLRDLGMHRFRDLSRAEQVYQLVHPDLAADFPPLKSLNFQLHNLPVQLTSFVGREQATATIKELLSRARLLTLVGAGGAGKTRLALQAGADALYPVDAFPDGVWFVELAPITTASGVGMAAARALGVAESAERTAEEAGIDFLKSRRLLLILDNCEHLIDACARFADSVLRACPTVRLLATSREALGILGETTFRVPSLAAPDPDAAPLSAARLTQYEAARLFVERAQAVKPDFAVTERNAAAVGSLCWRLDGIPLALELAAARVRSLSPEEINVRLDHRFRLLTSGNRAALPRQQTLRAAIDWSYDLLEAGEKTLLARLSVFVGGWTLDAAEAVCEYEPLEPGEVFEVLSHLVDRSLVVLEEATDDEGDSGGGTESGSSVRYRLLESIRMYGLEKRLEAPPGEESLLETRHRDYYLGLVESVCLDAIYRLTGKVPAWLTTLDKERENIEQALTFSWHQEDPKPFTRFAVLWQYWRYRANVRGGIAWMQRIIERLDPAADDVLTGDIHSGAALLFQLAERLPEFFAESQAALASYEMAGDEGRSAFAMMVVAEYYCRCSDASLCQEFAEKALALSIKAGIREVQCTAANVMGLLAVSRGEYEDAIAHYEASFAAVEVLNVDLLQSTNLLNRAEAHLFLGRHEEAILLYCSAMRLALKLKFRSVEVMAAEGLAEICALSGDLEDALLLLAASDAARERYGYPRTVQQSPFYDHTVAAITTGLEGATRQRLEVRGRQLTIADAFAIAAVRLPGENSDSAEESGPEQI